MNTNLFRTLVSTVLMAAAAACSPLVVERSEMAMGIDKTVGAGVRSSGRQVVLLIIADDEHAKLSQGESIRQEGRLPPLYARLMAELYRDYGLERVADWPLSSIGVRCLVFETDLAVSEPLLQTLRDHPSVESAQAMQYFSVSGSPAEPAYNDPYFELQTGHATMQIPASHAWSTGKGVLVAVIDTGLDSNHLDLRERIYGIRNFVDRSNRQFNSDIHGTAVAGVIAANANNATGIVGVAPDARILGLKACEQSRPAGRAATCNSFTLAKALDFSIDQRADIINLSLAGPRDELLERLIQRALARDAIVVGAMGRGPEHAFPSAVPGVIGVASQQPADARMDSMRAPGNQVVTTVPGNEYDFFTGNSFATAYVSGVVALVRQRKPHVSAAVVRELLQRTSDAASGYTNACEALSRIVGGENCLPQQQTNARRSSVQ